MHKIETAIITSGGFISSHLVSELKKRDIEPIVMQRDMLYTEMPILMEFLSKFNPSYIFHTAAYGNHGHQIDPSRAYMANVWATWNLLQASSLLEYRAFVNFGTSSMYGKKSKPMSIQDNFKPDTFYAATKASAAYLCRAFALQYDKPIFTILPFSIFGPGEADFRFIPTVCRHLITGDPMPYVDYPTHDWVGIHDFINYLLIITDYANKYKGEWVNAGTGIMRTNKEVVKELEKISGRTLNIGDQYHEQPHHSSMWVAEYGMNIDLIGFKKELQLTWDYYAEKYGFKA